MNLASEHTGTGATSSPDTRGNEVATETFDIDGTGAGAGVDTSVGGHGSGD